MPTKSSKKKSAADALYEAGLPYIEDGDFIFALKASKSTLSNEAMGKALGREIVSPHGGHHVATNDPKVWRKMCNISGAEEIAINLKKSGKVCHDIDFREGADGANKKLRAYFDEQLKEAVDAGLADHHRSQNGGEHVITLEPSCKLNGYIFPELQIKHNGYVLLPGPTGRYSVIKRGEELDRLPPSAFEVKERMSKKGDGAILPFDEVLDILSRNDEGLRYQAMTSLCWPVVRDNPDADIFEAAQIMADTIGAYLPEDAMREGKSLYDLWTNPTFKEREGEADNEMVRALRPLMQGGHLRAKAVGAQAIREFEHLTAGCYSVEEPEKLEERDHFISERMAGRQYTPSRFRDPMGLIRVKETGRRLVTEAPFDDDEDEVPLTAAEKEKAAVKERFRKHEEVLGQQAEIRKRQRAERMAGAYQRDPIGYGLEYEDYDFLENI